MNPYLITVLVTALLSASMAFGSAWKVQDWRYGSKEKERVEAQQIAEQDDRKIERHRGNVASAALSAAEARAVALGRTAAALATELAGLRSQASATVRFTPGDTTTACPDTANTLADLLGQCAGRYSEVAAAADGHANDAKKLTDAWPVE